MVRKMLKRIILFVIFSVTCVFANDYVIFVPNNAIPAEKTAGRELQKFLSILVKKEVKLLELGKGNPGTYNFYIGQSKETKDALKLKDFNSFKNDEIIIRRIGNNFYFTGDRPRGALYAVHTFLEDYCNMRFFAPDETCYPKNFVLPTQVNHNYVPPFMIRETHFAPLRLISSFAARRKINGHWQKTTIEWGGHEKIWGFCHTFSKLMPPDKYGKTNPDFYSKINGTRIPVGNQLCLSNKKMRKELINNIRSILNSDKNITIFSVSQNDNQGYCQCENCKKLVTKFGNSQSGLLVDCLNEIATAFEKEFPKVLFETIAYEYTSKAPLNIKPHKNVIIRLCADNCDYGQVLYSKSNERFKTAIKEWSKISNRLMMWNYVSLFYNYMIPNPNWNLHGKNLQFFQENKVIAVLNQSGGNNHEDFAPLRAYVNSKLLWNPSLDETKLIDEFVKNYYGKEAYPIIMEYLGMMKIDYKKQKNNFKLSWNTLTDEWLSFEDIEKARNLMNKALKVANGKYKQRVNDAKTAIDFAFLLHPETSKRYTANPHIPLKILEDFCLKTRNVKKHGEGLQLEPLKKSLQELYDNKKVVSKEDLPKELKNYPPQDIIVIPASDLTAYENKVRTQRIENFIRMRADHKSWLIQFNSLGMRTKHSGTWQMYLEIRTGGNQNTPGYAFQTGIYYQDAKKTVAKRYPFSVAAGKDFKIVPINKYVSNNSKAYFFLAPVENKAATPIDIKTLFLVKNKQ